jgi:hypothetical protein
MDQMVAFLTEINAACEEAPRIIKVIDEIAFQASILALNAAMEAPAQAPCCIATRAPCARSARPDAAIEPTPAGESGSTAFRLPEDSRKAE